MRSVATTALLVLAMAGTAAAQPGVTAPTTAPPDATSPIAAPPGATSPIAAPPQPTQQPGEELSEGTAVWLSLGGTLASWTLIGVATNTDNQGSNTGRIAAIGAFGTLLAPSFGHWYARSFFTRGLALRLAGALSAFLGAAGAFAECDDCSNSGTTLPVGLLLVGAGLYIGGTIDDIVTAPGDVRRYNHQFENVTIAPMIRSDSRGLMITGRF
jgi:hypothetical protein